MIKRIVCWTLHRGFRMPMIEPETRRKPGDVVPIEYWLCLRCGLTWGAR